MPEPTTSSSSAGAKPAAKGGAAKMIAGQPWYVWAIVVGAGLLVGWLLIRRDKTAVAGAPGVSPEVQGAMAGQPSTASAPADNLSPDVLAALGISAGTVGTLGEALAGIAIGAQNQLGYISATALQGSFGLAGQSFDFAGQVLSASGAGIPTVNIYNTTDTTPRNPYVSPGSPSVPSAIPSASSWVQQPGFYESDNAMMPRTNPVRGVAAVAV